MLPLDEELSEQQEDKTYNKIEKEELIEIIQEILEKKDVFRMTLFLFPLQKIALV